MSTNDTVVFTAPNRVEIEDREIPEPTENEVLIETHRTLISTGTELTILSGEFPENSVWDGMAEYPIVGGYCNVGTIVDVGENVDDAEIGKRVANEGEHARYVTAAEGSYDEVPDGVSDEEAVFSTIAKIVMNGIRRSRLEWGETAAVYGLGVLGQLATRFAHTTGARNVLAVDLADSRLKRVPEKPGIAPLNPTDDDWEEQVATETRGRLADVVFEVTGNPRAITDEFEILCKQGRLVLLSSPRGKTRFDFHDYCNFGSYEILGAHVSSHPKHEEPHNPWTKSRNAELFLEYLDDDRIDMDSIISHQVSYNEASDTFEMLLEDRTHALGVQFTW